MSVVRLDASASKGVPVQFSKVPRPSGLQDDSIGDSAEDCHRTLPVAHSSDSDDPTQGQSQQSQSHRREKENPSKELSKITCEQPPKSTMTAETTTTKKRRGGNCHLRLLKRERELHPCSFLVTPITITMIKTSQ